MKIWISGTYHCSNSIDYFKLHVPARVGDKHKNIDKI